MGPLHDPVTWYGINYAGTQMMQWDIQNNGKSGWTGESSFILEVIFAKIAHADDWMHVPNVRDFPQARLESENSRNVENVENVEM